MLKVGSECFVKGCRVEIMGQNGKAHWVVAVKERFEPESEDKLGVPQDIYASLHSGKVEMATFDESNIVYSVEKSLCEPLISDLFKVGDAIRSKIGSLVGTVTALELSTNKAICMSDKIKNYNDPRTRYAYTQEEIKKYDPDVIEFIQGNKYRINNSAHEHYLIASMPDDEYRVAIISTKNKIFAYNVDRVALKSRLKELYGIQNIQEIR